MLGKGQMKSGTALTQPGNAGQGGSMGIAEQEVEPEDGPDAAPPEEQAAYQAFVEAGLEVIMGAGDQPDPAIVETLKGNYGEAQQRFADADPPLRPLEEAPIDPLAVAACMVVLQIEDIIAESQAEIANEIVFHGGKELVEVLGETSEKAGIHDYSPDDLEVAFYRAIDLYRISSQRVDPQELEGEFEQYVAASQAGEMDGVEMKGGEQAPVEAA